MNLKHLKTYQILMPRYRSTGEHRKFFVKSFLTNVKSVTAAL